MSTQQQVAAEVAMLSKNKARKLEVAMRQLEAARANLLAVLGDGWRSQYDESPVDGLDMAIHQLDVIVTGNGLPSWQQVSAGKRRAKDY